MCASGRPLTCPRPARRSSLADGTVAAALERYDGHGGKAIKYLEARHFGEYGDG